MIDHSGFLFGLRRRHPAEPLVRPADLHHLAGQRGRLRHHGNGDERRIEARPARRRRRAHHSGIRFENGTSPGALPRHFA